MKEKSALFNLNKGYKSPLEGNAFGGKLKENMDKGMSKSDAAKQAAADLQDMPVDNRAGGSTPAANMNKGYGQQVKSPLGIEDGIIIKGLRSLRNSISSIGSDFEKSKVRKNRIASGEANDTKLQGVPTKAPKFSTGEYNKATADTKLKTSLVDSTKSMPGSSTQIPSVGTSGVQNNGSGNQGYGIGGSTKKPVVKVKTKPIVKAIKTVNAVKTTSASTTKSNSNRSDDFARTAAATRGFRAAKQKDKASGMSRKEVRLNKTKRKAAAAKAKTNKIAKSIDASKPKSADTGTKQIAAKSQRNKAKRLENRAIKIEGRIQKKKINKTTKQKIKSNI